MQPRVRQRFDRDLAGRDIGAAGIDVGRTHQ
jgi:hypothetical protein